MPQKTIKGLFNSMNVESLYAVMENTTQHDTEAPLTEVMSGEHNEAKDCQQNVDE